MENNISYDGGFKFKPDYKWPEMGSVQACPRCNEQLELIEIRILKKPYQKKTDILFSFFPEKGKQIIKLSHSASL